MAGNRVRITAQLVDAQSDTQLWVDTIDREFEDDFAVQGELGQLLISGRGMLICTEDWIQNVRTLN